MRIILATLLLVNFILQHANADSSKPNLEVLVSAKRPERGWEKTATWVFSNRDLEWDECVFEVNEPRVNEDYDAQNYKEPILKVKAPTRLIVRSGNFEPQFIVLKAELPLKNGFNRTIYGGHVQYRKGELTIQVAINYWPWYPTKFNYRAKIKVDPLLQTPLESEFVLMNNNSPIFYQLCASPNLPSFQKIKEAEIRFKKQFYPDFWTDDFEGWVSARRKARRTGL
ncbi:MAG: hypothetical protein IT289_04755 [Oligoflexia bacterium]|nr:hypothetical protein [Oligoflexia bacterium]